MTANSLAANSLAASTAAALLSGEEVALSWSDCNCGATAAGSSDHYPDCAVGVLSATETEHVIDLPVIAPGYVRAVCSCGWKLWGGEYPTRYFESRLLAKRDGAEHLRDPEKPAFKPKGW